MDSRNPALPLLGLILALLLAAPAAARPITVVIREPYLELHTGPGRGFPVFYAVERGASVELLQRRTDWYQLRTGRDVQGWVHRDRLALTLQDVHPGLRAAVLDRFISNRVSVSLAAGALEGDPLLRLAVAYHVDERYSAELGIGQVSGDYSSSRLLELSALWRPWPERRLSPYLVVGLGYFDNAPRQTLLERTEADGPAVSAGLGVSARLSQRFGLRADWRFRYADLDGDEEHFQELTAGFVLHF